jgi:Ubiquitin fusion degradation protein UFD1
MKGAVDTMRFTRRNSPKSLLTIIFLIVTVKAASRSSSRSQLFNTESPLSLQSGLNKVLSQRWEKAAELAALEQQVEDYNADWIARAATTGEAVKHRRLICLPLDERFDPPMGVFSHRHVQTGDKMSLPACFWQAIQLNHADVPWLFAVQRVDGVTGKRVQFVEDENDTVVTECKPMTELDQVVGGPLDFRAPACYVFLPWWMMRALGLRPRDIVQVEQIETVAAGSLAKLRPHSAEFAKDISNPQAVLETELRHYSSLTQGATIAFDYNKKRYWFDVVELRSAPRGEKVPMIKVQDCDIATDFLPSKDVVLQQRKKKRQQQQQDADE